MLRHDYQSYCGLHSIETCVKVEEMYLNMLNCTNGPGRGLTGIP